jgi:acetyltransferase
MALPYAARQHGEIAVDRHFLHPLFEPRSLIVLAGAEDSSWRPARQLRRALADAASPVPLQWLDLATTGTLGELASARADLALIALPPADVASALEIAGRIRCRAALVLAGADAGAGGVPAEQCEAWRRIARGHGLQLLGPNSLGLQRPHARLNASLLGPLAQPGPLALVSQSGALTAAMLDWASQHRVGFSCVVSLGPNSALQLPEVLDFLASDGATQSILVYMEGIQDARRFMSALRAAAYTKPVVVMKAGRQAAASAVAQTHSAAIVGADEVFDAALRRAGVVRVRQFTQLFSAAQCLASRFRPAGERLAIVTNGGGPAVLAADWAGVLGLAVVAVHDLGEDADGAAYTQAMQDAVASRDNDGVIVIHSPKPGCGQVLSIASSRTTSALEAETRQETRPDPDDTGDSVATAVAAAFSPAAKPVLGCWLGETRARGERELLAARRMPVFRTPEAAVDAFHSLASYHRNQQLLAQTPPRLASGHAEPDVEGARVLIEEVLADRRQVLTEMESKALLAAFQVPVTRTVLARSASEATLIASQLGFPVALKIASPDITHKSDVHGVALNLATAAQVRERYAALVQAVQQAMPTARVDGVTVQPMASASSGAREVYIGVASDRPFGPVISFGAGGTMIELLADRAVELPPLNAFLARRLIERSRAAALLGPWRGAPAVAVAALEAMLLRVSEMVCALPQLREMDINPVIVDENGAVAVDARIVVGHDARATGHDHHLAIPPYPAQLDQEWALPGGESVTVRAIRPDDAEALQASVREMSPENRYLRFASTLPEMPPRMLARYTLIDYDREMALVAVRPAAENGAPERIVGVVRSIANPDGTSAEFSLAVADDMAGRGLGARLMRAIFEHARERGLARIVGLILPQNTRMLGLMKKLGLVITRHPEDPDFRVATLEL